MEFRQHSAELSIKLEADVLVLGLYQDENHLTELQSSGLGISAVELEWLHSLVLAEEFKGKTKDFISIAAPSSLPGFRRLQLIGLGKKADFDLAQSRKVFANIIKRNKSLRTNKKIAVCIAFDSQFEEELVQASVEGAQLGAYAFDRYKSKKDDDTNGDAAHCYIESLLFVGLSSSSDVFSKVVVRALAVAKATCDARDLINEPACNLTPAKLADYARSISGAGLTCEILDEGDIAKLGMGAFLGVGRGSRQSPKFIVLRYRPQSSLRHIALVGKGITFDSGGLSLKTAIGMETMKYDMAGAAAVLGTMQAVVSMSLPISLTVIVAACENMPDGNATKPGDVLVSMKGKTIEVNNTDAEGRLTLADALFFAVKEKPDEIIDIATLTGAVVTALGKVAAGIMGTNDELIDRLSAAGKRAGEKYWRLPLFEEYAETLKSDIADLKNAGARGEAGSSSAGMFLKEFVDGVPWAHLDIAGVGWTDKDKDELSKGGTAFGVRTFLYYLMSIS